MDHVFVIGCITNTTPAVCRASFQQKWKVMTCSRQNLATFKRHILSYSKTEKYENMDHFSKVVHNMDSVAALQMLRISFAQVLHKCLSQYVLAYIALLCNF